MANNIYLNGQPIPKANGYTLKPVLAVAKNTSLQGRDSYDFMYRKREWVITWKLIKTDVDFELLYDFWIGQFDTLTLPLMTFEDEGLVDVPVYIDISDMQRKYNNVLKEGFSVVLSERDAS